MATDTTVIFQHIPKAAGSTLNSILKREYTAEQTYSLVGNGGAREAEFAQLPVEFLARIRLIKGHLYFGIHRRLPNPFTYITILRHPVDRVVSHYHYVKRSPKHYLYDRVTSTKMTLEEYVSTGISLELDNGQVRTLVGPENERVAYGCCTSTMLKQAQRHLREFYSVVGIAERFDETLMLMRRLLQWRNTPFYAPRNVTRSRPRLSTLSPSVLRTIELHNAIDLELYEMAANEFGEVVERSGIGGEVSRFRLLNAAYVRYFHSSQVARRMAQKARSVVGAS